MTRPPLWTLGLLALTSGLAVAQSLPKRPRLVVVISVDQLSEELMQRFGATFNGGLAKLRKEGVFFSEAYHDHAFTETGPGHSVLLTGRTPGHTGILENEWYDRATGKAVYCVADDSTRLVGLPDKAGSSNRFLVGDALGDWLQDQVPGSRVFSISGKDRAAILMAGRKPTAVYWFEGVYGFTTSTRYANALPTWLDDFNGRLRDRFCQESWIWAPLHPSPSTSRVATFSFSNGYTLTNGQFPRVIQSVGLPVDASLNLRLRASPFYDQITLEGAKALIEAEHLGTGKGVDLLTLSLSATDYVGHAFGPGSAEMEDNLHRLDEGLGRFLSWLQARVPELCIALTADHGGLDLIESLQAGGFNAKRLDPKVWMKEVNAAVQEELHLTQAPLLPESEPHQLFLHPLATSGTAFTQDQVIDALVRHLRQRPEVLEVATSRQLAAFQEPDLGSPRNNSMLARLKHSFDPTRSGDVLVAFKPMTALASPRPYGVAGHGSPHDYDRRVPLLFWGPWKAGERTEPVRTIDLAPTLACALGIHPSTTVDGKALDLPVSSQPSPARSPR